jgi:hypothetical protein
MRTLRLALIAMLAGGSAAAQEPAGDDAGSDAASTDAPAPEAASEAAADEQAPPTFNKELDTMEEQVDSLKERVFRAKATLQLLKEVVIQGTSSGARVNVWHINHLSTAFSLVSISYYLDGQGKFSKVDPTGELDARREFKVFEGAVPPGNHNLTVNMRLRGNGFGIFTYAQDYSFNVQSTTAFVAEEGKSCQVRVVAAERRGIARSFTERPNVSFETRCIALVEGAGTESSGKAAAPEE